MPADIASDLRTIKKGIITRPLRIEKEGSQLMTIVIDDNALNTLQEVGDGLFLGMMIGMALTFVVLGIIYIPVFVSWLYDIRSRRIWCGDDRRR